MARRFASAILTCLVGAGASTLIGCGSGGQKKDGGGMQDADFVQCENTPAVDYAPGMQVTSMSGAYLATLVSASTTFSDGMSAATAATGTDSWVISIRDVAAGAPAADVTMTAERPWMPLHSHGASTYPTVTPGDPGMFTVAEIILFQTGYWSLALDLQTASGAADKATFAICIRQ